MAGHRILKKPKPTRSARRRRSAATKEELIAKAPLARCWTCERDGQPISGMTLADEVEDAANCSQCGHPGVCRCVREGTLEHRWECYDCRDARLRWAGRVYGVLRAVGEKLGDRPGAEAKLEKLRELLAGEEVGETPHLDRWLEKLAVAA